MRHGQMMGVVKMNYMITTNELYHHGIKGMRWGIRRFQPYGEGYEGSHGKFTGTKRDRFKRSNRSNMYADPSKKYDTRTGLRKQKKQSFAKDVQDELTKKSKKRAVGAAADAALAVTTAAVASAVVLTMAKKGKTKQADALRVLAKRGVNTLKSHAAMGLISAGIAATTAMAIKGGREVGSIAKKGAKNLNKKRLQSASKAAQRDADDLRSHGYTKEANAVKKVADKNASKAKKLEANENDSAVTKRVKNDYNTMDDSEFMNKYKTTKKVYAKRVDKYGDPYMNSPYAKYSKRRR